jgi:hypothetical protein
VSSTVGAISKLTATKNLPKVGMLQPELDLLGNEIGMSTAGRNLAMNAKTERLLTSVAEKAAIGAGKSLITAKNIAAALVFTLSSAMWSGHLRGDNVIYNYQKAIDNADRAGNFELAQQIEQEKKDYLDPNIWEKMAQAFPGLNVGLAVLDIYESSSLLSDVNNKIREDKIKDEQPQVNPQTGEVRPQTAKEKYERVAKEEQQQYTGNIDYYNSERKKMLLWEQEAQRNAREEEANFWRKEREKQSELEAADRKAIGEFWTAYRKQAQKAAEDARPSKLNFGII